MDKPKNYLTEKDLEEYLSVSHNTTYKLRKMGLPFIKIDRKVLYRLKDVDDFLETLKVTIPPAKQHKARRLKK